MDPNETQSEVTLPREGSEAAHSIREDIARTRDRMDGTLDEIAARLQPRHLLDELFGWVRSARSRRSGRRTGSGIVARVGKGAGKTAKHMGNNMMNWIRQHPVPSLLLGGAVAAYIYESRSRKSYGDIYAEEWMEEEEYGPEFGATGAPSTGWASEPAMESYGPAPAKGEGRSRLRDLKERARAHASDLRARAGEAISRVRHETGSAGDRLKRRSAEQAARVRQRARDMWSHQRHQIGDAVEDHPITVGLGCMALGLLAGMLIPETR